MRAIPICPRCRGDLATNVHPVEKRITPFVSISLGVPLALFAALPGPVTGVLMGVALTICLASIVYLSIKTRDWQRFKRYEEGP